MKNALVSWGFTLSNLIATSLFAQDFVAQIEQQAVPIPRLDSLDVAVYKKLSQYQVIMIGEMHGTEEPSLFLEGLCRLFTQLGDSVQVGFEIPVEEMVGFNPMASDSSILKTRFFQENLDYGMATKAIAHAILKVARNTKAEVFFFDGAGTPKKLAQNRDQNMFEEVKERILKHPNWKTLTVSGNLHNMFQPIGGIKTMASFLVQDQTLNLDKRLCTLNHFYHSGTMLNNQGNGLKLHTVNHGPGPFSAIPGLTQYLFIFPEPREHHGIFYTQKVTASFPAVYR